jgi:hypothetical protein
MLVGTLRLIDGKWYVDSSDSKMDEPVLVTIRWKVIGMRSKPGNYGPMPEAVDGLTVTHVRDSDQFEAYKNGNCLVIDTEHSGTVLESPIPVPKVHKGIETRYSNGRWQKLSKRKGWVAA